MIVRKWLHDELVPLLHDLIIEGELGPGTRIHELALCARLGVSRTPLREALKMLSVRGLVRLCPHRGAIVVHITRAEVEELIPLTVDHRRPCWRVGVRAHQRRESRPDRYAAVPSAGPRKLSP